jgi:hypothetical protein
MAREGQIAVEMSVWEWAVVAAAGLLALTFVSDSLAALRDVPVLTWGVSAMLLGAIACLFARSERSPRWVSAVRNVLVLGGFALFAAAAAFVAFG